MIQSPFQGSAILICFVIRAESQLRGPPFLGSNGSSQNSSLKQAKFNTSRSSLDENYCTTATTTTTANVNSPLSCRFFSSLNPHQLPC